MKTLLLILHLLAFGTFYTPTASATTKYIPLAEGKPYIHVVHDGRAIKVQRIQDTNYELHGFFARSVRECPPFCLQPVRPAPKVELVGEIELFAFMETHLRNGTGLLVDTRTAEWYSQGTIPGSINIPFSQFNQAVEANIPTLFAQLGVKPHEKPDWLDKLLQYAPFLAAEKKKQWDFNQAKQLILWCNGPACDESPKAIRGLLAMGYPVDKVSYYRGGMQMWQFWGLTTVVSK